MKISGATVKFNEQLVDSLPVGLGYIAIKTTAGSNGDCSWIANNYGVTCLGGTNLNGVSFGSGLGVRYTPSSISFTFDKNVSTIVKCQAYGFRA